MNQHMQAVLNTAVRLCQLGIKVFPLNPISKKPLEGLKWKDRCTSDIKDLPHLFPSDGYFGLAVRVGPASGILDLEPDDEQAREDLDRLIREAGVRTVAYTSRRGTHYWFKYCPEFERWGKSNPKAGKLEIRLGSGDAGLYSACPPSIHEDTKEYYQWVPGCSPWESVIAEVPQSIKDYFFANVKASKTTKTVELEAQDDGFLPGPGHRHEYMVHLSKMLYIAMRMPRRTVEDIMRVVSSELGTYDDPKRGETEIRNLVNKLHRPKLPIEEYQEIDFQAVNEFASHLWEQRAVQEAEGGLPEIPSHVPPAWMQAASVHARAAQYPRNLFITAMMAAISAALGTSVKVRAGEGYPSTGLQLYTFGVGGSGTGKSKTLKAVLAPLTNSDVLITDATPEALVSGMSKHPRSSMLELSEGKDFFKMLGRYSGTQGGPAIDNSVFHKAWSGDRFVVARQKGTTFINDPFLTVAAGIQRYHLMQIPQNDLLDGLMQRMTVYPLGDVPDKPNKEAMISLERFWPQWNKVIDRLLSVHANIGMTMIHGLGVATAGVGPLTLTLTPDAQAYWESYAASKRSLQVKDLWPEDHPFRSDIVRHAELALRVAGAFQMAEWAMDDQIWTYYQIQNQQSGWISLDTVKRAIDYQEWTWQHKMYYLDPIVEPAFARVNPKGMMQKQESIIDKVEQYTEERRRRVERNGEVWTLRDYYRTLGLTKAKAEAELALLYEQGRVRSINPEGDQKVVRYQFVGEARD